MLGIVMRVSLRLSCGLVDVNEWNKIPKYSLNVIILRCEDQHRWQSFVLIDFLINEFPTWVSYDYRN